MQYPTDYQAAEHLLKDRVILITGAGDGIGRQIALACARHGAQTILLGKTVNKLEKVYDEIEALGAPEAALYPLQLEGATPADYAALADILMQQYGRLDGLLHNAAALPYLSRIKDYEPEDWLKVIQTNLNAPFMLSQALLEPLLASPSASVLFTSDQRILGKPFWGAYAASKAASDVLALTWAEELRNTSVRVNCVDPGPTLSPLRKRVYPGEDNQNIKSPEALESLYLWLLSDDSAPHTAETFTFQA